MCTNRHIDMYMYVYIYVLREREREREREGGREKRAEQKTRVTICFHQNQ